MKQIPFLLLVFHLSLLLPPSVFGQKCSDYACVIAKVKKAFDAKNYRLTFEQMESAENYPNKNTAEIADLRKRLFSAIEKEKEDANKARLETKVTLDKLKITAFEAVTILLDDIDRNILHLEYDFTFKKCQTAINLDAQYDEVQKRILEIAYFYAEADSLDATIKMLKLLNINASTNRKELRELIKNIAPQYFKVLEERYYPKMIDVQGGSFIMNDSNIVSKVHLTDYQIARTETTYWQYNLFVKATHHIIYNPSWQFTGDNPAVVLNWYDATLYLNWLSERNGVQKLYELKNQKGDDYDVNVDYKKRGFRLPTEAEWEFAARGGILSKGYIYSGDSILTNVGWYNENSNTRTRKVATLKSNELGLYDMTGNVWEWCGDWYDKYENSDGSTVITNPIGAFKGTKRVDRGGSWVGNEQRCRIVYRHFDPPNFRGSNVGFRAVFK